MADAQRMWKMVCASPQSCCACQDVTPQPTRNVSAYQRGWRIPFTAFVHGSRLNPGSHKVHA
jgi:hypothetical protein